MTTENTLPAYGMKENGNYLVRIKQAGGPGVKAYMPEQWSFGVSSQFSQPFGQGVQGAVGMATKVLGIGALTSQSMTAQVWEGTQPMELTIELEFLAESNPLDEVLTPIKNLIKMVLPSKGGSGGETLLMQPPGPAYASVVDWSDLSAKRGEGATDKQITIHMGNFMIFDSVVIESVNTTVHSMMHNSGVPLHATCSVTFKTFFVPLLEDVDGMFRNK